MTDDSVASPIGIVGVRSTVSFNIPDRDWAPWNPVSMDPKHAFFITKSQVGVIGIRDGLECQTQGNPSEYELNQW